MATTISGTISLNINMNSSIPAGGNVLSAYTVPVNVTSSITYQTGTGANQTNLVATAGGTATATPANVDMRALTAEDGTSTSALAAVREVVIFNDATNAGYVLNLILDASNAWTAFMSGTLTGVKLGISAGAPLRLSRPLDSAGWTVDSTHKVLSLDPGANTIPYRVMISGN